MRKISTISTLMLLVVFFLGCGGKPAEIKQSEKEKPDTKLTQAKDEVPDEGTIVIGPTGEPKKTTRIMKLNPPIEQPKPIRPNIKHSGARTNATVKSVTVPNPALPQNSATTKVTSPDEGEEDAYTVVQIFYGTDRERTTGSASHPLGRIPWTLFAMATGIATLLAAIVCGFWIRGKSLWVPFTLLLVTGGLGAMSVLIPANTKPDEADTSVAYNAERGKLEMGTCNVSIPKTHKLAELESPSIFRLEISEDTAKHIVLLKVDPLEEDVFVDKLRERVQESEGQEAIVFIHGYNVTFEDAARRTAQLVYDLEFKGAPILYSWPSQGSLGSYLVDESNVEWTVSHLKQFLKLIAEQSNAKEINLIAHSMGNRALTRALEKLSYTDAKDGPIFDQIMLTAPDIDVDIFRNDLAPRIIKTAQRVTLYASSNDKALAFSKTIHGFARAGESGENVTVVQGIDTIDVSELDTSLLGHSYYGSNETVLTDMAQLLFESKEPKDRSRLQSKILNNLTYWVFLAKNIRMGIEGRGGTTR